MVLHGLFLLADPGQLWLQVSQPLKNFYIYLSFKKSFNHVYLFI